MESKISGVYRTVPLKVVEENSKTLGIEDAHVPKSTSDQFVENFIDQEVGERKTQDNLMGKLRLQVVLLDPPHRHPKTPGSRKPQRLSSREKKRLKLHQIPREGHCYEDFLPLHELWLGYMEELLQLRPASVGSRKEVNLQQLNLKVMKADYHGSILRVWRSKCPSYVGIEGILLQETQNTLQLIPKDNRIRTIPKAHSIFTFEYCGYRFYLYGNHMKYKASERSVRKFKMKHTLDL